MSPLIQWRDILILALLLIYMCVRLYVWTNVRPSVCLPVCPSRFRVRSLFIFWTLGGIYKKKLSTNVNLQFVVRMFNQGSWLNIVWLYNMSDLKLSKG